MSPWCCRKAQTALLGLLILATLLAMARGQEPEPTLIVTTWNLLAAPFTKYNKEQHRNWDGPGDLESEEQTRRRYELAGDYILSMGSDVFLLQECEEAFFEDWRNPKASAVRAHYHVVIDRSRRYPGTAVLVRTDGRAQLLNDTLGFTIGGTPETGGSSKTATVQPLSVAGRPVIVVSVHLPWGRPDQCDTLLSLVHSNLANVTQALGAEASLVLGGDFNISPAQKTKEGTLALKEVEKHEVLATLVRAGSCGTTGLSGDLSLEVEIDYLFVSPELTIRGGRATAPPVRSPYLLAGSLQPSIRREAASRSSLLQGPAPIVGPSDHVPVSVVLDLVGGCLDTQGAAEDTSGRREDNGAYTYQEFLKYYGEERGRQKWAAARKVP